MIRTKLLKQINLCKIEIVNHYPKLQWREASLYQPWDSSAISRSWMVNPQLTMYEGSGQDIGNGVGRMNILQLNIKPKLFLINFVDTNDDIVIPLNNGLHC